MEVTNYSLLIDKKTAYGRQVYYFKDKIAGNRFNPKGEGGIFCIFNGLIIAFCQD